MFEQMLEVIAVKNLNANFVSLILSVAVGRPKSIKKLASKTSIIAII